MKTFKLLCIAFSAILFIVLINCSKKEHHEHHENALLAHLPMPAKLDSAMRQNFDSVTFKILKNLNVKNTKSFVITKNNYFKMIDAIPENANRVAFNFVQFNKAKFPNKYPELSSFDGMLYLIYNYMDAAGKNVGDKAYAILGTNAIVEISSKDLEIMKNDYKTNIKPKIDKIVVGSQGNTLSVKMNKDFLQAYKKLASTKTDVSHFKITLAQMVKISSYKDQKNAAFSSKIDSINDDSEGQITFITDCVSKDGSNVNRLSGGDLNSTCPNTCP